MILVWDQFFLSVQIKKKKRVCVCVFFCRVLSPMNPPVSADCPGQGLQQICNSFPLRKSTDFHAFSCLFLKLDCTIFCMYIASQSSWSLPLLPIPLNITTDFLKCIILFQRVSLTLLFNHVAFFFLVYLKTSFM